MDHQYYFVYQTTNKINGRKYIGKHSTDNLNDGYIGSGKILKQAIKKYGKENFDCVILQFANSIQQLNALQKKYISVYSACEDDAYYNIAKGGDGGDLGVHLYGQDNPSTRPDVKQKMKEAALKRFADKINHPCFGKPKSEQTRKKISQKAKLRTGINNPNYNHHWTDQLKNKMSERRKGLCVGGDNPRAKKVYCQQLNRQFGCIKQASEYLRIDRSLIRDCCNDKRPDAKGFHFIFLDSLQANTVPSSNKEKV